MDYAFRAWTYYNNINWWRGGFYPEDYPVLNSDLDEFMLLSTTENKNEIMIMLSNKKVYDLFVDTWINGPSAGRPITHNKFDNGSVLECLRNQNITSNHIEDRILYVNDMHAKLTSEIGPEYIDWHLYYDIRIQQISSILKGPSIAISNSELYTWLTLRYHQ